MVAFYRDVVGLEIQSHDGDGTTLGAGSEPLKPNSGSTRLPPNVVSPTPGCCPGYEATIYGLV